MKSMLLIGALALSLAANVWLVSSRVHPAPANSSPTTTAPAGISAKSVSAQSTASPEKAFTWSSLQAGENLPNLVAGLRAAGFPTEIIRHIADAVLNKQFAARRKQIYDMSAIPIWKLWAPSTEQSLALRALEEERLSVLQSLGFGPFDQNSLPLRVRQYGNLSPAKMAALEKIHQDYGDLVMQLYRKDPSAQGSTLEAQRKLIEQEQRKDLVALLTPTELEDFDMRQSKSATTVRASVQDIDISEEEYRTLFRLVQTRDEAHPTVMGVQTPEMLDEQTAASRELLNQVRVTLGDDRFLKYFAAQSSETRDLTRFASNNPGLTVDQILRLFEAQGSLTSAMTRANRKPGQTSEDWEVAVAKVAGEFRAKLAEQIGADRLDALVKGNYGQLSFFLKRGSPPPKN